MKLLFFPALIIISLISFNCTKELVTKRSSVNFKNCTSQTFKSETVTICFDSVLSDSRCPANAICVWRGTAIAKFSFTANGNVYPLTLATSAFNGVPSDTVVTGYKIKFLDLSPYPGTYTSPLPAGDIKADVEITR